MTSTRRHDLYGRAQLQPLLQSRSIAIIGASEKPTSFGARTLAHLGRFGGDIHLVNARRDTIDGRPCYPNMFALPDTPDVAMLTIPRDAVEAAVIECAERGVKGVVIGASGYAETGKADRIALQDRLVAIAREAKMLLIGPNCLGVVNYGNGQALTFATTPEVSPPGRAIGIVSQSGALGCALAQGAERGVAISHVLTSGNSCDVDMADYVAYLAEDPDCHAIACLFEGMSTPDRLIEAARLAWRANKPVIVHKIATGTQGAAAAMSHTGSLAGSDLAYRAAFEQAGVILVDRYEALIETAAFFAKAPAPTAPGAVVVATSGGAAIMAADAAEAHGVPLPQPTPATKSLLETFIPEFGSSRNPCDVTAQVASDPQSLFSCTNALLEEPQFGAMIVPHPYAYALSTSRIKALGEIGAKHGKPVCLVWLTENLQGPGAIEAEQNQDVMLFRSMEHCLATLAAWHAREELRRKPVEAAARLSPPGAADRAAALIASAEGKVIAERDAKQILAAYGVDTVTERLATTRDEAMAAADQIDGAMALKVESPAIPHKTEAGVIRLGIVGRDAAGEAYDAVMANALKVAPAAAINGVLIQPMVPPGIEMLIGGRVDPLFGPLIVVGLGGILVELLGDSALALAPVSPGQARAMLGRLRGRKLLEGFRNMPSVDIDALAMIVCRVSELIADQRDRIAEIDVNPLICSGAKCVAVDGLIALAEGEAA